MNVKEFEESIEFVELARVSDDYKFLFKSNLNVLLNGGKLREILNMYSVGRVSRDYATVVKDAVDNEKAFCKKKLIRIFEQVLKDKSWELTNHELVEFDAEGRKVEYDDNDGTYYVGNKHFKTKPLISKSVSTTVKTTFYLARPFDMKAIKSVI